MSVVNASTIAFATVGTIATGCLAYAVYFDYKRRNDPAFRRALKRDSKKEAKVAKVEAEESGKQQRRQVHELVDEANEEGYPSGAEEKEALFMQEVSQGENMCQDTSATLEAALCFFKAFKVYPAQSELMNIYDKTVPKPVLDVLAEMVAYDRTMSSQSAGSAAGIDD